MHAFTRSLFVIPLVLLIAACGPGAVAPTTLDIVLDGEPAGVDTDMTGTANVTVVGDVMTVDGAWLWGNGPRTVTVAHVHGPAAPGEDAPPIGDLAVNNEAQTFEGTFTMSAEEAEWFLANQLYINVHTEEHPGGEIRGQIVVP